MSPVSWVIITILKKKINSFRVGFDAKLLYFLPHRITNEKTGSIPTFFFKVLPLLTLIDLFHKNMSIKLITLLHKKARQCTLQKRILPPSMHYPLLVAGPGATVGNRNTNRNGQKTQRITHTLNGSFAGARVYLLSLLPPPPYTAPSTPLPEFRQTFSSQCLLMLLLLPLYRSVWVPQLDFLKHELFPLVGHRAIVFLISLSLLAYNSAPFSPALSCSPPTAFHCTPLHNGADVFFLRLLLT